jgi:hypothetical protein
MQATSHPYRLAALIAILAVGLASPTAAFASYGWPVKPFQQQHAIRSYFGDPRIGVNKCVHFGIDISAPDGTPVYATISGVIRMHPLHPTEAVMVTNGSTTYEYWHLRPAFTSGHAVAYRTVLGWIMSGYQHVHFSERHGSTYVNPLRPDGLQPYLDTTRPSVGDIDVNRNGGGFDLSAEAHDTAPLAVPAPWDDRPLTPALVQWRIQRVGAGPQAWKTAVDFRGALPNDFYAIFTPETRQNTIDRAGTYHFALLRCWRAARGTYRFEVRVADTAGNAALRSTILVVGASSIRIEPAGRP